MSASSTIGWSRALARSFGDAVWSKVGPPGHVPATNGTSFSFKILLIAQC